MLKDCRLREALAARPGTWREVLSTAKSTIGGLQRPGVLFASGVDRSGRWALEHLAEQQGLTDAIVVDDSSTELDALVAILDRTLGAMGHLVMAETAVA